MLPFNKNWPRWIVASVRNSFVADIVALNCPLYLWISNTAEKPTDKKDIAEWRLDGPEIDYTNVNYIRLYFDMYVIIDSTFDREDKDMIYKDIGYVAACYRPAYSIYRYGDGPDDDVNQTSPSVIGCLQLVSKVTVVNYGQVDLSVKLAQAVISARYEITFQ